MSNTKLSVFYPIQYYGTAKTGCGGADFEDTYNDFKSLNVLKDTFDNIGVMISSDYAEYPLEAEFTAPNMSKYLKDLATYMGIYSGEAISQFVQTELTGKQQDTFATQWNKDDVISMVSGIGMVAVDGPARTSFGMKITSTSNIFAFHDLDTARKCIKVNIPIASLQYNGTTKYYTWDLSNVLLQSNTVQNIFKNDNYAEYKKNFDIAINNCNEASDTFNAIRSNLHPGNHTVYTAKINDLRENGLVKPTNISPPPQTIASLYSSKKGAVVPTNKSYCFLNPNTTPWFDPAIYGAPDQLGEVAKNCAKLTTIMKQEAKDCCVNPNAMVTDTFAKCPDKYTLTPMYGCCLLYTSDAADE